MYRSKETLQQAPQNKRKDLHGTSADKEESYNYCCRMPRRNTLTKTVEGQGVDEGGMPCNRRASDFSMGHVGSAIPRPSVTY